MNNLKEEKSMRDLKAMFGQQIQLKLDHCLQGTKMLNTYYCVIDAFKSLKDKNGKTVLNALIKIVNESNHKPNKLYVDQGREFYNKFMQE